MNTRQRILLVIAACLLATAGIFPSWIEARRRFDAADPFELSLRRKGTYSTVYRPAGRHFIYRAPPRCFINTRILLVEWGVGGIVTAVLYFVLASREPRRHTESKAAVN